MIVSAESSAAAADNNDDYNDPQTTVIASAEKAVSTHIGFPPLKLKLSSTLYAWRGS